VITLKVPEGLQQYSFVAKVSKGASMTIGLIYDSRADQSQVKKEEDPLALVSLIPTSGKKPKAAKSTASAAESEEIPLVALVPLVPKKRSVSSTRKVEKKSTKSRSEKKGKETQLAKKFAKGQTSRKKVDSKRPALASRTSDTGRVTTTAALFDKHGLSSRKPGLTLDEENENTTVASSSTAESETDSNLIDSQSIEKTAPGTGSEMISLGVKAGHISPIQNIGGPTYTFSLDMRYIFGAFDGDLELGIEAGYYRYQLVITTERREIAMSVLPLSLQMYYRLPIDFFLSPFVGFGGDVFLSLGGVDKRTDVQFENPVKSVAIAFGGHVAAGVEARLGPGYLLAEVRGGMSFGESVVWSNANISGLSTTVGYRFLF